MILAIAAEGELVAQHFGRCSQYVLFTIDNRKIVEEKTIQNPGHEPGFLPRFLADKGVNTIIAGGMGPRAQALFAGENIEAYIGVNGLVKDAAAAYLLGELQSGPSTCDHPQGGHGDGHGNGHGCC